ncbi:nickel pincer cofactor biosynthesis protein LarC [Thermococcus sp. LS2]|uniref:nickel pincer cofactor biosynthesis protein LarC n=1 Tax=Thermococcus sp. LS2 TaxID=1638260 RepID=UPI00143B7165|nr:nickel pincer cofactor biosynthesis protein LarC [Thermococcus sp. LS2]NJE13155.1 nickel pincer cofactor biosynthesis protein LarC [Thermococcus sp. LS2]
MTRVLYLDPFSGIAGDMFLGMLVDLGLDVSKLKKELDRLNVEYELKVEKVNKRGISATSVKVLVPEKEHHEEHLTFHHHHGMHLSDVYAILDRLDEPIQQKAKQMFEKLAEAESKIHGVPKEKLHFHEVGAIDAIIEIVGAIVGLKLLNVEKVYCGIVNVGTGFVEIEHGKYPIPAPATAELLRGIPIHIDPSIKSELVTPTGALILSELVDGFGSINLRVERVGYGAGDRDLEIPNVLRGYLGFLVDDNMSRTKRVALIETNIDDMNPEFYGYVMEKLFENGALDVSYTPIYMKKNRPGVKISVICPIDKKDEIIGIIMKETTSIGVRVFYPEKIEAQREIIEVETGYGKARVKIAKYNSQIVNIAPEYESCKEIAERSGKPLKTIYNMVYEKAKESLNALNTKKNT